MTAKFVIEHCDAQGTFPQTRGQERESGSTTGFPASEQADGHAMAGFVAPPPARSTGGRTPGNRTISPVVFGGAVETVTSTPYFSARAFIFSSNVCAIAAA